MEEALADQPFAMTVDMSVLESLGINLYSNAAAVLSELVANAWDADANSISIDWANDNNRITVADDGSGMTVEQLNERFLKVGYKKRSAEGTRSAQFERPFMGRKGIGKLSVFSIADQVTVYSVTDNSMSGFTIEVEKLREDISANRKHHPAVTPVPPKYQSRGTTLVLDRLRGRRAALTAAALRKRLARRFDVLDERPPEDGGFSIYVNGKQITFEDRQELKRLEFIWEFGSRCLPDRALPTDVGRFVLDNNVVDPVEGWTINGWIGTAKQPNDLTDDADAGSLKNIIVLARGRPIQEGILEKLNFSSLFANYVTGQISADFLDLDDGYADIATSDRQRLIEDDDRVIKLQEFLRDSFVRASNKWREVRPKKKGKVALDRYPKLKEWISDRPGWQRPAAEKMINTIASLELDGANEAKDRAALFRSGILAFERVGLRETSDELEKLTKLTAVDLLPLLENQSSYESALWVDILRSRLEAITRFRDLSSTDEKEKVLQKHLFHNLWLLDPSWERATGSPTMEEDLRRVAPGEFPEDDEGKEIKGRIDIRYATTSGKHIIVELKRYSVKTDVNKLAEQGTKYFDALSDVLTKQQLPSDNLEVIFVLGDHPPAKGRGGMTEDEFRKNQLRPINGRYVLYDELIGNSQRQYSDYLEASATAKKLDQLLDTLGASDDSQGEPAGR